MGDIKEIRVAALAYYHNFCAKEQHEAYLFFQTMDKDDDGKITMEDFKQKFEGCFGDNVNRAFQDLDKNGDGNLDFEESIILYYCLMAGRIIICHCCKAFFLKGLYFTCVDCFKHNQTTTFDLCISCYDSREYAFLSHEHCNFLDNYALLATYRLSGLTNQPASSAKSVDPKNYQADPALPKGSPGDSPGLKGSPGDSPGLKGSPDDSPGPKSSPGPKPGPKERTDSGHQTNFRSWHQESQNRPACQFISSRSGDAVKAGIQLGQLASNAVTVAQAVAQFGQVAKCTIM